LWLEIGYGGPIMPLYIRETEKRYGQVLFWFDLIFEVLAVKYLSFTKPSQGQS
jgi:hypothetical protein